MNCLIRMLLEIGGKLMARVCPTQATSFTARYSLLAILLGVTAFQLIGLHAYLPPLDESLYLHNAAMMVEHGSMHLFSWNPLPTLVNGLLYLPFAGHPIELGTVSVFRQCLTFVSLLIAVSWAVNTWRGPGPAWAAVLIVAFSRASHVLQGNCSDALYAIFIVLVFASALRVASPNGRVVGRVGGYLLLGFVLAGTAMARNDGLIVGASVILVVGLALFRSPFTWRKRAGLLLVLGGSFALPIIIWVICFWVQAGVWSLGSGNRAYFAFRQGYYILNYGKFDPTPGMKRVETEFDTEKDNDGSVLKAVWRHPSAFSRRIARVPKVLFHCLRDAYGIAAVVAVAVALIAGMMRILHDRQYVAVALFIAICAPLAVYFVTFFRPGYLAMNFPLFVAIAVGGMFVGRGSEKRDSIASSGRYTCLLAILFSANAFHLIRSLIPVHEDVVERGVSKEWVASLAATVPRGSRVLAVDPSQLFYAGLEIVPDYRRLLNLDEINRSRTPLQMMLNAKVEWVIADADLRVVSPGIIEFLKASPDSREVLRGDGTHACLYHVSFASAASETSRP